MSRSLYENLIQLINNSPTPVYLYWGVWRCTYYSNTAHGLVITFMNYQWILQWILFLLSLDHLDKSIVVYRIYLFAIIIFQINLCFQKIAAEVLGIKLTKNEMEQQSVSFCNLGVCSERDCVPAVVKLFKF